MRNALEKTDYNTKLLYLVQPDKFLMETKIIIWSSDAILSAAMIKSGFGRCEAL